VHASPRVNRTVRTPIEPAQVVRLGHVVLQTVDFAAMPGSKAGELAATFDLVMGYTPEL